MLCFARRGDPRESSAATAVQEVRHDRRRRTAAAATVRHRVVGHVPAGLRRRHDGVRTGYRVRVHGSRRPARQYTRHTDADRLPGGVPRQRHVLLGQLRDRSVRDVLVER